MPLTKTRPKRTPQHRKRTGDHHRKSKDYFKTYWPYLPMLLVVAVGLVINTFWTNAGHVLGATSDFSSNSLLADTNAQRVADHEQPLTLDRQLMSAAQAKANDMVKRDYWSHNTPDGKTPWTFITAAGYQYEAAGENLAYGFANASDAVTGWMNSPSHRANILDAAYQNVGFGVASSPDYQGKGPVVVIVAMYAEPVPAAANITFTVPQTAVNQPHSTAQQTTTIAPASRLVSRIQVLTGGHAAWSLTLVSLLTGAAIILFVIRHGNRLRKLLIEGETFVAHHPMLDLAIVIVATAGLVLTRASGTIH